jgi:hypothetical protein
LSGWRCRKAVGSCALALLAACASAQPLAAEPVAAEPAPEAQAKVESLPVTPVPVPQIVIVQSPAEAQVLPPAINEEDQQALALLADLQRYATDSSDDLKRELAAVNQAVNRTRSDANRIRLAMLLTLPAAGPTDDARALSLLDAVPGKPGGSALKQIAVVLSAQISERARSVREEQRKTAAAQEKLDALRAVERTLLLERSRNAGGAGGGGGGGTGR